MARTKRSRESPAQKAGKKRRRTGGLPLELAYPLVVGRPLPTRSSQHVTVQLTYEVVTPESAEEGEASDYGFAEPGGWRYSVTNDHFHQLEKLVGREEALKEMRPEPVKLRSVAEAVDFIEDYGSFDDHQLDGDELSLVQADGTQNYRTGERERLTLHVRGDKHTLQRIVRGLDIDRGRGRRGLRLQAARARPR